MNDLVIMKNQQAVTISLQVAETFRKRHDHLLRDIEQLKKDVPNFGEMFAEGSEPDSYGRDRKVFYMNRDGFTLLAMGFTGNKAMQFKLQYIQAFNQMENQIKNNVPSSYVEALRLAADLEEEKTRLVTENEEHKQQLEKQMPQVTFAKSVEVSQNAVPVKALAGILKQSGVDIGQNRLFQWLRDNKYLSSRPRAWNMPTQKSMDLKLFELKPNTFFHNDGVPETNYTTLVTGKGQVYFVNKFLNQGKLQEV